MTGPSWSRSPRWTAKPITASAVEGWPPEVLVGRVTPGGGLSIASDWPGLICNFSVRSTRSECQRPHGVATCGAAGHADHPFLCGLRAVVGDLPNRTERRLRAPAARGLPGLCADDRRVRAAQWSRGPDPRVDGWSDRLAREPQPF